MLKPFPKDPLSESAESILHCISVISKLRDNPQSLSRLRTQVDAILREDFAVRRTIAVMSCAAAMSPTHLETRRVELESALRQECGLRVCVAREANNLIIRYRGLLSDEGQERYFPKVIKALAKLV
ncbi:MAG: hypothetical protein QM813_03165 [Verrucomicrobiota bacterium]